MSRKTNKAIWIFIFVTFFVEIFMEVNYLPAICILLFGIYGKLEDMSDEDEEED